MSELSTQLLSLVIALVGFGIIVSLLIGGASGPKKFLGCLFAPLRWMTRGVLVGLVILAGLAFLFSLLPGILPQFPGLSDWLKSSGSGPSSTQPPAIPQQSTILLDRYPMLAQRDVSIYSSESFAETMDGTLPVKKQACLATSYLMMVRAHSNRSATIGPDRPALGEGVQYSIKDGAMEPPGFSFERKAYDSEVVVEEITGSSHPVILRAEYEKGSSILTHYVLAVGYNPETREILYNDPWFDDSGGNRPVISAAPHNPALQRLPNYLVTRMFVVKSLSNP